MNDFAGQIGLDGEHFSALTYQELFGRMIAVVGSDHTEYLAYLTDRYMSEATVA